MTRQGHQTSFLHINSLCLADLVTLWASEILLAVGLGLQIVGEATLSTRMSHKAGDLGLLGRVPRRQCQSLPDPGNLEPAPGYKTGWARGLLASVRQSQPEAISYEALELGGDKCSSPGTAHQAGLCLLAMLPRTPKGLNHKQGDPRPSEHVCVRPMMG